MSGTGEMEVYECGGCGGEIEVVHAIWLSKDRYPDLLTNPKHNPKPYCSEECAEAAFKREDKMADKTPGQVAYEAWREAEVKRKGGYHPPPHWDDMFPALRPAWESAALASYNQGVEDAAKWKARAEKAETSKAELLKALKDILQMCHAVTGDNPVARARAAIAKAEEK